MSATQQFIEALIMLKTADLSLLRRCSGLSLHRAGPEFDLFTGLWWPIRQTNRRTPARWSAWLVAKLYGSCPLRLGSRRLAALLGAVEPPVTQRRGKPDTRDRDRFRGRFDILLMSPALDLAIEPHLKWCFREVRARGPNDPAIDWVALLDDLWKWDRGNGGVQREWTEQYLNHDREAHHEQSDDIEDD